MSKSADAALAELFAAAKAAQANAYAPYSRFPVGAALRTPDGRGLFRLQRRERRLSARALAPKRARSPRWRWPGERRIAEILRRRRRRGLMHALRRLPPAHPRIRRCRDFGACGGAGRVRAKFTLGELLPDRSGPGHLTRDERPMHREAQPTDHSPQRRDRRAEEPRPRFLAAARHRARLGPRRFRRRGAGRGRDPLSRLSGLSDAERRGPCRAPRGRDDRG